MGFQDIFHFDEAEYIVKIEGLVKRGCYVELAQREINKRRRIYSSKVKLVCTAALLFPTGGATAFGFFLALRQGSVARKKYDAVISAMRKHNITIPTPRKRDKLIPLATNIIIYSVTLGLLWGFEELEIFTASGMHEVGIVPSADLVGTSHVDQAAQFASDPSTFLHGMAHGAEAQVGDIHAAISPHETVLDESIRMAEPIATSTSQYVSGETAGYAIMPMVEKFALVNVASQGMETLSKSETKFHINRKPVYKETAITISEKPITEVA